MYDLSRLYALEYALFFLYVDCIVAPLISFDLLFVRSKNISGKMVEIIDIEVMPKRRFEITKHSNEDGENVLTIAKYRSKRRNSQKNCSDVYFFCFANVKLWLNLFIFL